MIQDYSASQNNYGVVANHPELMNVNGTGGRIQQFWNHVNGIDYNPQLDQIMLSVRNNSELFISKDLTPRGRIETYTGAATDTVGLGLPDMWVRAHFSTLSAVTATSSHSGNGLTDLQEYQYGLDPTVWSSTTNGIPDGWAIQYGFDPTAAGFGSVIASNGITVLQSYLADLNPTNAASCLAITGLGVVSNSVHLTWIGGNNSWQYLECAPTMTSNQWTAIFTNIPPTATTNAYLHSGSGGFTNLFYRIRAKR